MSEQTKAGKPGGAEPTLAEAMAAIAELRKELTVVVQRNQELEAATTGSVLPMEDQPVYEIVNAAGYFSPDCVFYPEGVQFVDLTGTIIPNEAMLPLNLAAEERMNAWLNSLPSATRTPPLENILQAAMEMRDFEGDRTSFFTAVLERAISGAKQHGKRLDISQPITRPVKHTDIPLMTHGRFNGRDLARPPQATRYRGQGPSPADRQQPATTNQREEMLGRFAAPRVFANRS